MPNKPIHLSPAAADDLRHIQQHTISHWGIQQWRSYADDLDGLFKQLRDNPALGPKRNEVRLGLRSFPIGAHIIWYRNLPDTLEIVRVLHAAMSPDLWL